MSWQLVIGLILLAPLSVMIVALWVKWTLYAWRVRGGRSIVDEIGTGRDHWIIWLIVHSFAMAFLGMGLLVRTPEGAS